MVGWAFKINYLSLIYPDRDRYTPWHASQQGYYYKHSHQSPDLYWEEEEEEEEEEDDDDDDGEVDRQTDNEGTKEDNTEKGINTAHG